jgi:integrase
VTDPDTQTPERAPLWGALVVTSGEERITADAQCAWERLSVWSKEAVHAYAPTTIAAWRSDWGGFVAFCRETQRVAFPASSETIAAYIATRVALKRAASAIQRAVSTLAVVHRAAALPNPCQTETVRLALKAMRRQRAARARQARGLTWSEIARGLEAAPRQRKRAPTRTRYSLRELRDRALVGVAYDTLARSAEVVAMQVTDFHLESPDGSGTVLIVRAKNDPEGEGREAVLSPDTVARLREWLQAAQIRQGPMFLRIVGSDRLAGPLRPRALTDVWRRVARAAGLPIELLRRTSSHSTRIGAAQDLADANTEMPGIMLAGGWKDSRQVVRYIERQDARRGAMANLARVQGRWKSGVR